MSKLAALAAACALLLPFPAHADAPGATFRPSVAPTAPPTCGDFLAELGKKPAHLKFVGCAAAPDRQGKPLRATYRVSGAFAAQAEAYLARAMGLARLKRSCCQWDAPARTFNAADGRDFSITMVSDQTPVATRGEWSKIPTFEIFVETMSEEI